MIDSEILRTILRYTEIATTKLKSLSSGACPPIKRYLR